MGNQMATGRTKSMPAGLALGAAGSLGITFVMAAVGAKLVDMGTLKEGTIGYIAMVILLAASFCGGMISVGCIKRRKLMVCGLSGLIYYGILLSMTALFFGGQYAGMGVTALMVLCGCGLVVLSGARQGRGVHNKRRRKVTAR